MTARNIRAGWAKAGLFPFDPAGVLCDIPKPLAEQAPAAVGHEVGRDTAKGVPQTPVTPRSVSAVASLHEIIQQDARSIDEESKWRLQKCVQKLANASILCFAERDLLQQRNNFLVDINNEGRIHRSTKAQIVGTARVMSYEEQERSARRKMPPMKPGNLNVAAERSVTVRLRKQGWVSQRRTRCTRRVTMTRRDLIHAKLQWRIARTDHIRTSRATFPSMSQRVITTPSPYPPSSINMRRSRLVIVIFLIGLSSANVFAGLCADHDLQFAIRKVNAVWALCSISYGTTIGYYYIADSFADDSAFFKFVVCSLPILNFWMAQKKRILQQSPNSPFHLSRQVNRLMSVFCGRSSRVVTLLKNVSMYSID
ncbi:hypothetical protein MRB53_038330 [Persea americana]|nr:hypothetical protein MRB53_038330 [Persea americana]